MFYRCDPGFICILLLLCLSGSLQGQGWERAYGNEFDDAANQVLQTQDGGFVFVGTTIESDSVSKDIYLVKTNATGLVQWSTTIGSAGFSEFGNAIAALPDGYILAGNAALDGYSRILLARTDLSGNVLWTQLSLDDSVGVRSIEVTTDGFALLGARYQTISDGNGNSQFDSDLLFIKTNWDGQEQWRYTYGGAELDEGYDLYVDPNGNFMLAGYTKSFGSGDFDALLIRLNPTGQELWAHTYGDGFANLAYALAPLADTAFVLTGQYNASGPSGNDIFLAVIDTAGQQQSFLPILEAGETIPRSIQVSSEGGFLLTGETQLTLNDDRNVFLQKFDAQGNVLWQKTYGGTLGDGGKHLIQPNANSILIAGFTRSIGAGNADAYLIHTDSLGVSFPGRLVGQVFFDQDLDCYSDGSEAGVPQAALFIEGEEKYYLFTDTSGHFSIHLDTGSYTVSVVPPAPYWESCFADSLIQVNPGFDSVLLDFPLQPLYDCPWIQTS
ncbi:MAG: hypothetical protein KDC44_09535, partial [Phaeodactylibacter sp.]|nr:hypothetical protein [Phaeodactylibacter sp.]